MVRATQQPVTVVGRDLMISVSIGASVYPDHGSDAEALLRHGRYRAVRCQGTERNQLFSPELPRTASAKFTTEQGLRHALERGEFEMVFQPGSQCNDIDHGPRRSVAALAPARWAPGVAR